MGSADPKGSFVTGYPAAPNGAAAAYPYPAAPHGAAAAYPYPAAPNSAAAAYPYPAGPNAAAAAAYPYPAYNTATPYPDAAAYAYPAYNGGGYPPPPPPPYAAPPYPYPSGPSPALRRLVSVAVAVFLIIGACTLIVYLVLRPRVPTFFVTSASVSSFNLSSNSLSADFNLTLSIFNPNKKMTFSYDPLTVTVFYRLDSVTDTAMAPLSLDKREEESVQVRLAVVEKYVGEDLAGSMQADREDGTVRFQVGVSGWVAFNAGGWRTRRHVIRVFCADIDIGVRNYTGSLVGPPRQCRVSI